MLTNFKKKVVRLSQSILQKKSPLPHTPDIRSNKFLFIGGLHRSGTSILHRLLCEHPSTSGFFNTGVPEDEGQHLQSVFPPAKVFGGPGRFAFDRRSHLTEASQNTKLDDRNRLLREWGAYYDMKKPILLEKSPPNLIRSRFLQKLFPDAQFVFLVRHPIPVALSTGRNSIIELMVHWYVAHKIMLDDLVYLNKYLLMRYEDFVKSPKMHLDKIFDFVGIEQFTPHESIKDHNVEYFFRWKNEHSEESELLEQMMSHPESPIDMLGYRLSDPYVENQPDLQYLRELQAPQS